MKRVTQILTACGLLLLLNSTEGIVPIQDGYAQNKRAQNEEEKAKEEEKHKKLVREMEKLIKVAREAGFPEEDIQKITIEQDGDMINVWDFLEEERERLSAVPAPRKVGEKKRHYLTVQDVTSELIKNEPDELSRLRKELIFSGEEQK